MYVNDSQWEVLCSVAYFLLAWTVPGQANIGAVQPAPYHIARIRVNNEWVTAL